MLFVFIAKLTALRLFDGQASLRRTSPNDAGFARSIVSRQDPGSRYQRRTRPRAYTWGLFL